MWQKVIESGGGLLAEKTEKDVRYNYNLRNAVVNYFLLVMFTFFPLFLTDQYAHARNDKFVLYIILSSILTVFVLVYSLFYMKSGKEDDTKKLDTPDNIFKFSLTDYGMFAFLLFAAISTVFSDYKFDSLTGAMGRNNGLILIFLYVCVYFVITRFYILKEYVFAAYIIFSSFVAGLAVLNYFYIDPFGILKGYSDEIAKDFGSTIGNKNTIASFICLFLPVAVMIFVLCKKRYMRILSGIGIVFAYTGLLSADSNSGYLGLFCIVAVMALFCVRKYVYLLRYSLALVIMFASGKLLRLFSYLLHDNSKPFEDFASFLIYNNLSYIFIAVPLVLFLILLIFRKPIESHYPAKVLKFAVITVIALIIAFIVYKFITYTFIDTESDLGWLTKVLRFDEKWGTHRGYMWIYGMEAFSKFDFFQKLFGSGPDTFYHVFEPYFKGLMKYGDTSTDCIHNEYLNYLVTQGILGLLSYLTILVSVIKRGYKHSKISPFVLVPLCAVICYAAQSAVNIYQPITTPVFMIFISITEALARQTYKTNDNAVETY